MANSGLLAKRLANANHPQSNPPEIHTQAEPKRTVSQNISKTEDHDILNKKIKQKNPRSFFQHRNRKRLRLRLKLKH